MISAGAPSGTGRGRAEEAGDADNAAVVLELEEIDPLHQHHAVGIAHLPGEAALSPYVAALLVTVSVAAGRRAADRRSPGFLAAVPAEGALLPPVEQRSRLPVRACPPRHVHARGGTGRLRRRGLHLPNSGPFTDGASILRTSSPRQTIAPTVDERRRSLCKPGAIWSPRPRMPAVAVVVDLSSTWTGRLFTSGRWETGRGVQRARSTC